MDGQSGWMERRARLKPLHRTKAAEGWAEAMGGGMGEAKASTQNQSGGGMDERG